MEVTPVKLKVTCEHLRHKLMYCDERQTTPGLVDDSSDTRVFFCIRTYDSLGPDGKPVSVGDCAKTRGCYCGNGRSPSGSGRVASSGG